MIGARTAMMWRRTVPAAVVIVVAGTVAAAAVSSPGYRSRHVTLDDGSIWSAQANSTDPNNPGSFVGRANVQAAVIDAAVVALPRPQLLQDGPHVVFHDAASGTVTPIDTDLSTTGTPLVVPPLVAPPGTVAAGTPSNPNNPGSEGQPPVDLNEAGEVGQGADTLAVVDQGTGKVYVFPADAVPGGPLAAQKPAGTVAKGARLVVDVTGTVHVVSPSGVIDDFSSKGAHLKRTSLGADLGKASTPGSPFTVTSVGTRAVVLDGSGALYVEGHPGSLGEGSDGGVLQEPGPDRSTVLVETPAALTAVDLGSGKTTSLSGAGSGPPTAPVFIAERGCTYGAWAGSAAVAADASTTGRPAKSPTVIAICDDGRRYVGRGEDNPQWRVNHGSALLNDELTGNNQYFDQVTPLDIDDWSQAQRPSKGQQSTASSGTTVTNAPQPSTPSAIDHPPQAVDDTLATRPGLPLIAHVLANDSDADGDVLAVTGLSNLPVGGATVAIVNGGNDVQVTPAQGTTSPITFAYTIDDGRGETSSAHVTVAIHPLSQNAPPLVPSNEPAVTVDAGAPITVDLLRDATDPDGDALTLTAARLSTGAGSVETTPAGLAVVTPATAGSTVLSFTVSDGHGGVTQGTQTFNVSPAKSPIAPQTHDDHLQVAVGAQGTIDVLANDTDGSGSPLTLSSVTTPPGVTVTQLGGGLLGVTPTSVGTTLVKYTATDGAQSATSTLRVDAVQSNPTQRVVAVRDDAAVRPGVSTVVPVLANDIDQAGNVLVVDGLGPLPAGLTVTQLEHAALSITTDQPLAAPETFTYDVSDGVAASTGTVVVRPAPGGVDQPPVTASFSVNVRAGNAIPIDVLAHDFDPEGETLTLVSVGPPAAGQGTAFVEAGQLRYLAPPTPLGAVPLTYVVRDSAGNTGTGTVVVHVLPTNATNHPPQPPDVTARVFENRSVTVELPLLGTDPDGDVTTLVAVAPPTLGGQVLGSIESPLALDHFTFDAGSTGGTQQLTYQVRDAGGLLASGAVHIGVVAPPAQNSPPVALPDTVSIAPGALRRVAVLANDSDPDGDPITIDPAQLTRPSAGSATVDGPYLDVTAPTGVPDGTKISLDYGISDGRGGTDTSTVTETVTAHPPAVPPIAVDDTEAPQRAGAAVSVQVLANDTIVNGTPAEAKMTVTGGPTVTVGTGGVLSFVMPGAPTTFAYTVTDVSGQAASAIVTVPLAGGQPPVASPDTATTTEGKPVSVDVIANDRDPQGLALKVTGVANSSGGKATVADPAHVTFTPAAGFTGLGGFSYVVSNGQLTSTGSAVVHVNGGADHPPTVSALTLRIPAGTSQTVDLTAAASDPDAGDKLTFSGLRGAGNGVNATLAGTRLTVSTTAAALGHVTSLGYTVSDGHPRGTVPGSVGVTVTSSTRPLPRALPDTATALGGAALTIPVLANDVDPLGQGLRLLGVSGAGGDGTATVVGRNIVFTPNRSFHGIVSLSYQLADASNDPTRHATGSLRITVVGVPDPPGLPSGTANSRTVLLTWAVPSANGGTISGYTVGWAGGTHSCPQNSCTIGGLANGHDYAFSVTATDQAGTSTPSPATTLHVDQIPDVPQAPSATPGDQKISLSWPVPHTDGSAPSSYDVVISPGGTKQTVGSPAATFSGLTNGTAYTFTVDATNKAGTSQPSAASAPVTPAGLPGTPSTPKASTTPDAQTAVATWTAPASNGSPITSYSLEVFDNGALRQTITEKDTSNLTATVPATNGDSYAFAVSATNAVGATPYSPRSNVVKASGRPTKVGTVTATAGDGSASLAFSAPADNGSAITSYTVTLSTGGTRTFTTAGGTVSGLTNGQSYSFTASACNANGCGAASANSSAVTPYTTPDAPSVDSSVDTYVITWKWNQPPDNGRPVTGYTYYLDGAAGAPTSATSFTKTFACGETHKFRVTATNAAGAGPSSSTASATTAACPPVTYAETEKDYSGNTFHDYHNASNQGPDVAANQTLLVSCKVYDPTIQSVNPDGYWYQLSSAPWNNYYYESANAFVNGGAHTDRAVPDC